MCSGARSRSASQTPGRGIVARSLLRGHRRFGNLFDRVLLEQEGATVEPAQIQFQQALELATQLGMRPLVAHRHLDLGRCWQRVGQGERAREHIATSAAMYRDMEMRSCLEWGESAMG